MTRTPTSEEEYRQILASLPEAQRGDFTRLMETMRPWEELNPALMPWVEERDDLMVLKHPLVFSVPYSPTIMNGFLNQQYAAKREALREAREEGEWFRYVFLHERPYRLDALGDLEIEDDCDYWELVGHVWTDSENIWEGYEPWSEILHTDRPGHESMMDDEERAALAAMPETLTIYRGYRVGEDFDGLSGFSWTLDRDKAHWFAIRRWAEGDVAMLATGTVAKEHVIAHFTGRGEAEIVVLPEHVTVTSTETLT